MEVNPGYRQTEVGVIPGDWETPTIQELLDRGAVVGHLDGNHGALYPRSHEFKEFGVPYITANDLCGHKVDFSNCKYLSEERARRFRKGVAKDGDVLFAHNATVGPTALLSTELAYVILSTTVTYFRCRLEKLHNSFLLHALQSAHFVGQYRAVMAQSTRNQVPITTQRKLSLTLPPTKAEQEAIAEALSGADALIESLEQLLAKKRQLKQGAMQQLLTGKTRLPGFSEEWKTKQLAEVLKVRHGKSQRGVVVPDGRYPILASGGEIGRTNTSLYDKPSVLIGRKGTIDDPQFAASPFWTVDTLFFTEIADDVSAKFIFYKFCMINWRSYNEASGVPSLNARTIECIEINLPQESEQTAIAAVLSDMDAEIAALERRRGKTKQIKQGMMQSLLTGRVRLVNPPKAEAKA